MIAYLLVHDTFFEDFDHCWDKKFEANSNSGNVSVPKLFEKVFAVRAVMKILIYHS